eukprot:gnl/TRDRNA2_/TRDRNA2_44995_c0_seq1.p1 gnl/TRDRNA2_/TRDRNA2_44995_c0~~gnl/TRDRNA2_/TRDRNA2_44995_c0_seq1.p1  ORF type:complete len:403 (-),score=55.38 gnl/TRDRNA2_/TRDRNA2_44995_c0_seq1:48-1256(-)
MIRPMGCSSVLQVVLSFLPFALVVGEVKKMNADPEFGGKYDIGDTEYSVYWRDLAPLPVAISDATASTVGSTIYLIGGCDSPKGNEAVPGSEYHSCLDISEKVMKYDAVGNEWSYGDAMPYPRFRHAATVVGTDIYIIGGRDVQDGLVKTVLKYSTKTDEWHTVQHVFEEATSDNAAFAHGSRIYTCGGWTATYDKASDACFVLDTASSNPTFVPLEQKLMTGRGDFSISVLGGIAHAFGGFDSAFSVMNSMETLNLADLDSQNKWWTDTKTPMTRPRGDFAAAVLKGRIMAMGGEDGNNAFNAGESLRNVEAYSPSDGTWLTAEKNMPIPHKTFRFCGAAAVDAVYIFGGQREYDEKCQCYPTSRDVFSYTETTSSLLAGTQRATAMMSFVLIVGRLTIFW